ncbi:type III effector [Saccharobesus litoralis]|uniref:Type III effector n=1 Tax=Saccharobesus litoralis TaxID=2172099 RepID=A0A2S0VU41_9ALTE|nr:HopJ type III effector protein [Saccharobesus litoralis]AWB67725.1 type III effector [Saccharobesus litoralis]
MSSIEALVHKVKNHPEAIEFSEVMSAIDSAYDFTPTAFTNGDTQNASGQNNGSCKVFALAKILQLTESDTLALFGEYYRNDVLGNPQGDDHQNIRNFIKQGWAGIKFEGLALSPKSTS